MLNQLKKDMQDISNKEKAVLLSRFFKTGKGEYGEGDKFLGITVPEQRKIAKKYSKLSLNEIKELLQSDIHEHRLTAWIILTSQYSQGDSERQSEIFDFTINNMNQMNNWDLVDITAPRIIGSYILENKSKISLLHKWVQSSNLWTKRIAILSTFPFIKKGDFNLTFQIAKALLRDRHDLIHKAVGWMLREVGKIDQKAEEEFLKRYYKCMPRTMLRYAIEKFDEKKRKSYLK